MKKSQRTLELLAPAKDLACGMAAIDHGADAVYIGPPHHGARAAAGNSLDDIQALCLYAHRFGAKVHVTVNTLVYDDELDETLRLVGQLADMGVDALLIQDMGLLSLLDEKERERLALHASTQCDTRSAAKARWLRSLGFSRVVLARELSLREIKTIHEAVPDVELEVFVHGALCVSYSGVCYASQFCFGRSANRGECAQFCRLPFDLLDADGHVLQRGRHFLSLKDMCRIDLLEALADAGACSFKIEGRLKDVGYVKNVVAAYSQRLDDLVARHPEKYRRASSGRVACSFKPDLQKTFNRGYTTYFAQGRQPGIASFDTPKALGEMVGRVKEVGNESFTVAGTASFANGDGLCFFNGAHGLEGFRVNRAAGNRLYPFKMPHSLRKGMVLYRNNDVAFERLLSGKTAERRIPVAIHYGLTDTGFALHVGTKTTVTVDFAHEEAAHAQADNIRRQLSKLGDTPFVCTEVAIDDAADRYFIPNSLLAALRHSLVQALLSSQPPEEEALPKREQPRLPLAGKELERVWPSEYAQYPYLYNVANHAARAFYERQGVEAPLLPPATPLLMQCRHCLRYSLGFCERHGGRKPAWKEPLRLRLGDGRRFRLEFKCSECQMNVYAE